MNKLILLSVMMMFSLGCSQGWDTDANAAMYEMCTSVIESGQLNKGSEKATSTICACVRDQKVKKKYESFSEAKEKMSFEELVQYINECK